MTRAELPRMPGAAGWAVIEHALRQALRGRRLIALAVLAIAPAAFAIAMDNITNESARDLREGILYVVAIGIVLPLISLTLGAAAVREELEQGTMVHIVTRPIRRHAVALARMLGTMLAAVAIVSLTLILAALVIEGFAIEGMSDAIGVGVVATLAYTSVFAAFGTLTRRGVLAGIAWLIAWDLPLASFGTFLAKFTVAYWVRSLGAAQSSTFSIVRDTVGGTPASGGSAMLVLLLIAGAMAAGTAVLFAWRELPRVEHE